MPDERRRPDRVSNRVGVIRGDDADRWLIENDRAPRLPGTTADWLLKDVDVSAAAEDQPIIYFLQAENGGPVKIGSSTVRAFPRRLQALRGGNAEWLEVRRTIMGNAALERAIHHHFAHLRVRVGGEWFALDEQLQAVSHARSTV